MMNSYEYVESIQGTYLQNLIDGVVIMEKLKENLFILKFHLNNGINWQKEIETKKRYSLLSETEKNINIYCNKKLQVFKKQNGNVLMSEDENMFHLGVDFFIKYEQVEDDKDHVKMSCFRIGTSCVTFSWTLPKIQYGRLFSSSKWLFLINNLNLINLNLDTGAELWRKEFSDDIQKIEVWEEKVVLVATSGNQLNALTALDAETGRVIWEREDMFLDLKIIGDKVYTAIIDHTIVKLVEVDPIDCIQSVEYDLTQIILTELGKVANFKYTIQDSLVYLSVISRKILLVIDFRKNELVWRYDFAPPIQGRNYWIDEPQVSENRLYVMDEQNTLHIFEREK